MLSKVIAGLNRHSLGQKKLSLITRLKMSILRVERSSLSGWVASFATLATSAATFATFAGLLAPGSATSGRMNFSPSRSNRSSFRRLAFASRPSTWIWISC